MKKIFKHFGIFLAAFGLLFWLSSRPVMIEKSSETYRSMVTSTMQSAFGKANMYSEQVQAADGKQGIFRLKMTNDAELQKQIKIAKEQGLNRLNVDGKEFFVDSQLFWIMPLLLLLSLLIAVPMGGKPKLWSLVAGSLIFTGYTLLRLYIMILDFLSNQVDIGIYQYDEFWSGLLEKVASTQKAGFSALMAFIIALIFAGLYSEELKKIFDSKPQKNTPKTIENKNSVNAVKKSSKKKSRRRNKVSA